MFGFRKKNSEESIKENPSELRLVHLVIAAYAICLEELKKNKEIDSTFPKLKPDTLVYLVNIRLNSLNLKLTAKQAKNLTELGMSIYLSDEYFWLMLANLKEKEKALMNKGVEDRRDDEIEQYEQTFYGIQKYFKSLCVDLSP